MSNGKCLLSFRWFIHYMHCNLVDQRSAALHRRSSLPNCQVDKPGSMTSITSTHNSTVFPLLLFVFPLSTFSFSATVYAPIYLVNIPGQEPPAGQTSRTYPFQRQSLSVFRNHSPCRSSGFSSLPPGILKHQNRTSKLFSGIFWKAKEEPWEQNFERLKRNLGSRILKG